MPEDQEDQEAIVLSELPDEELVRQMHDDLYDGLADEIVEGTTILLDRGWAPNDVLNQALVEGMRIVGSTSATASCSCRRCCWPPPR